MDLIFLIILGSIGIMGFIKGRIKVSKKKELKGVKARILSSIFILAGVQLVIKNYVLNTSNPNSLSDQSFLLGYLLGTVAVVAICTIFFMIFGQEDIIDA